MTRANRGRSNRWSAGGYGSAVDERPAVGRRRGAAVVVAAALGVCLGALTEGIAGPIADAGDGRVPAGRVVRVEVPEAIGGKTVIGQLTVDNATEPGFVTAYGCADGLPHDASGAIGRSDVNYDGRVTPVASNRLIVQADEDGEVCFYTSRRIDMIIDVNAVSFDTGINSFTNRRTDTRTSNPRPQVAPDGVVRIPVAEAVGGRTVIGQLTVDRASDAGFVIAYGCADDVPTDGLGRPLRSDLNYDGRVSPAASNRLVVQADDHGDVCFTPSSRVDLVVDVNGVADVGISSFPNRRRDTRTGNGATALPALAADEMLRVRVPGAQGGGTVLGQLTVDRASGAGFVTAFGCGDGLPSDVHGGITRSDLNIDGRISPVASNRLVVQADDAGDVCFSTSVDADLIVDVNAVSHVGITSFPNRRTDTRTGTTSTELPGAHAVPQWPPFDPAPALDGVAALTGAPASATITQRSIVAVKIDNYGAARPPWGLERADAIIEANVEGITRFVALFHTHLPERIGPVRSARTADLDLLAAMNRPVFAYSGANEGVSAWIAAAAGSGVLVDFTAQRNPCFTREPERPRPHNLWFDPTCGVGVATTAGPAGPLWEIDPGWVPPPGVPTTSVSSFVVPMDGVQVGWTWDPATRTYQRWQDGLPHVAESGARIAADNVVVLSAHHVPSPVDARSPNPITVGAGAAVVHRDGRAIAVTWERPTPYSPFSFRHPATGAPVPLDRGTTFVQLVRGVPG